MSPHELLVLAATCGAVTGSVLALTGAGGGVVAVPLLVLLLHLPMQQAVPVSLVAVGAAAWLGALVGLRQGLVRYRAAALIGAVGALAAPWGLHGARVLPAGPLMLAFSAVLLWSAWRMSGLRRAAPVAPHRQPCRMDPATGRLHWTAPCAWALGTTGAVSGLLSGLLGLGGGFVIVPALTRFSDIPVQGIVATSLGVIALVATSGVAAALRAGGVPTDVLWPFGLGCMASLLALRGLAPRIPAEVVRRAFALLCLAAAAMLIARVAGVAPA